MDYHHMDYQIAKIHSGNLWKEAVKELLAESGWNISLRSRIASDLLEEKYLKRYIRNIYLKGIFENWYLYLFSILEELRVLPDLWKELNIGSNIGIK